ncbi:hypothetical protein FGO68_gene3268 [Halteria grandinella]|uniref:Secreted protein n=1 Tax=Halteria grandinella TaxID=5974 RepID=A0A8J8NZ72_HALGN|nr:hypothetical protein FGO68_gene3268 [Halteria grandinella]
MVVVLLHFCSCYLSAHILFCTSQYPLRHQSLQKQQTPLHLCQVCLTVVTPPVFTSIEQIHDVSLQIKSLLYPGLQVPVMILQQEPAMHQSSQVHETLMHRFFVDSENIHYEELYFTKLVEILQVF